VNEIEDIECISCARVFTIRTEEDEDVKFCPFCGEEYDMPIEEDLEIEEWD
jgi:rRNA maturation endonuclease Nob1